MISCTEKFGSRRTVSTDEQTSIEQTWILEGSNDELAIRQAFVDTVPPFYIDAVESRTLYPKSYEVEQTGFELWDGTITYVGPGEDPQQSSFSFDTTGGTAHVTQSFGTRRYGESAPDHQGAIGVTQSSVEGVDIIIPSLKFSETHPIAAGAITNAYVQTLAGLTGSVNGSPWRVYPAESVLFVGATGQSQTDGLVPVTFSFEVGLNATLSIAGIDGIDKKGFEYLWTYYEDKEDTDAKKILKKPEAVYVERVYRLTNFGLLGV